MRRTLRPMPFGGYFALERIAVTIYLTSLEALRKLARDLEPNEIGGWTARR